MIPKVWMPAPILGMAKSSRDVFQYPEELPMIFDFRLRPPYRSFRNLGIFHPPCNEMPPQKHHARPSEAARNRDFDAFLKEMESAGIGAGVVMGRRVPDDAVSVSNDDILELGRLFPDTFVPFVGLDVSRGVAAVMAELEKCVAGGARGVALEPAMSLPPRKADAAVLYPVYARCEQAGLVVVLTMSFFQGDLDYSDPVAVQHVARDFPRLQIVVAHGGYPWIPMVYQLPLVHGNVWLLPDIYAFNPMAPGNAMFGEAMQWLDGENILFGSAFPCYNMQQAVQDLTRFHLSESVTTKFLHDNACRLLGLNM